MLDFYCRPTYILFFLKCFIVVTVLVLYLVYLVIKTVRFFILNLSSYLTLLEKFFEEVKKNTNLSLCLTFR